MLNRGDEDVPLDGTREHTYAWTTALISMASPVLVSLERKLGYRVCSVL